MSFSGLSSADGSVELRERDKDKNGRREKLHTGQGWRLVYQSS